MPRIIAGSVADFPDGVGVGIQAGGRRLAVFRLGARLYVIDDACPHRGFPLNDGTLEGLILRCRNHGACFDLATGSVVRGPASVGVRTYPVAVVGDRVEIEI